MIEEGDRAPAFELPDADGNTVRSADLAGKRHVIYFYPRDFTPGCTTEAGEFSREHARFKRAGIEVIGISPDGPESHRKFCDKMGIKYTLLADTDKKAAKAFGVWGPKKFMGKEYEGVTRSTFLVDEKGVVARVFAKVKPAGHAEQVLEAFEK